MAEPAGGERVKPCLSCDALISYQDEVCPHCSRPQEASPSRRSCPHCSALLDARVLFCSKCGKLAVPTARIPVSRAPQAAKAPASRPYLGALVLALELSAVAFLAFVLIDHWLA